MKALPVNDAYNVNVKIREDGRVMHEMYLWQVKAPGAAKSKYDYCTALATIPAAEAWRPLKDGECPLVKG
jgi:branched-chain amino acid transport system substrate-binding protein